MGCFAGVTSKGVKRDTAYKRMALTGWTVGFALPVEVMNAPGRRVAWTGAFIGAGIVVAALGLAVIFARRMATRIATLASSASAVGRGDSLTPSERLPVAEMEEMSRSLASAGALLQARARERAELLAREQAARTEAEAAKRS
jgi:nitrogen fixation/metabolism regulation signal transduction histidine kinase